MIVVAMIAIFMTIGMPSIYHALHRNPMQQATFDLEEAFRNARMQAIMKGVPAEVVLIPADRSVSVRLAPGAELPRLHSRTDDPTAEGAAQMDAGEPAPATSSIPNFSAQWAESVAFKQLLVNLRDYQELDEARIRFYPNGTSDALIATLVSEANEERTVTLEITTGRSNVEVVR